jgi:hypothetical protein
MRRLQAIDGATLIAPLTDVVRSGVFRDHLLAATRRILYEHRIVISGRRRLSELAGDAATAVERDALEVIERDIPAAMRAQWSAALSQTISGAHLTLLEYLQEPPGKFSRSAIEERRQGWCFFQSHLWITPGRRGSLG